MTSRPRKEMADSRLGLAPQPAMQPDKHKEGGEPDQGKGEDVSPGNPPVSASSASSTTTSSSSSSSAMATVTTTTTTTTSSPSSSISSSTTSSTTRGTHSISDVSSTCSSNSSSIDSSSVNSNNRVSSAIGVGTSSVGSSLSNPGMGNPFARAAPQASWGSTESCEQRPILAPSRLSSQTDSGSKVSSTGVLRPPSLGASGRLGGPLRPPTVTFFPPPTLTVTGSSPPQAAKSEFKLKPSVLGSPNPFAKSVPESPGEKSVGEREGSSRVLSSSNQQEDATPPVTGSQCQVSSSTPAATTTSSKEVAQGTRTPTQTQDTKTTTRSPPSSSSSNNNTPGNSTITTTTSNIGARSLFLPLSRSNSNSDSPTIGNSSFIFGQNLHSKVASGGGAVSNSGGDGGGGASGGAASGGGGGGASGGSGSGGGSSGVGASGGGGAWGMATDAAAPTTNGEKPTGNLFSEAASEIRWSDGAPGGGGAAAGPTLAAAAAAAAAGATTNGQPHTGNLFSEAASEISRPGEEHQAWGTGQSLAESSRELTEKEKSQKRKFDEVEVITGEENESNVLQMNCKLYAWVSGWWQERGRGILRLNDWDAGGQQGGAETAGGGGGSGSSKEIRSRLVIRTQGTLTVMLNTKVWAEMSVERASSKSVRFTALDADGQPKIFLAMGSPKDVDLLHNSLEWRVAASRAHTQEETATDSTKKAKTDDNTSPSMPL